ncbi:MAG TPA: hypothetical protein PK028_04310 [Bacteroidales bacterium]|nr:hypothetical protein [Bacteroidales bacterium]HPA28915.1 hypothetical protein [Bacteroidales bacterium]
MVLPLHDKINNIKAFAVGLAIGDKTVCRVGFSSKPTCSGSYLRGRGSRYGCACRV